MTRWIAAAIVLALLFAPTASASPTLDTQCSDPAYVKLHPTICSDNGVPFLLGGGTPGTGSGDPGSILGTITGVLHTLTGGLL
jgi:hypothetical protein